MVEHKKKSMGRPRKGVASKGKTAVFATRITQQLRDKLQAAADAGNTSLSDTIEKRLWMTFELDEERAKMFDQFGGRQNYAVCVFFAQLMIRLSGATGKSWNEQAWTVDQLKEGISRLLLEWRPAGKAKMPPLNRYSGDMAKHLGKHLAEHLLMSLMFFPVGDHSDAAAAYRDIGRELPKSVDRPRNYPIPDKDED